MSNILRVTTPTTGYDNPNNVRTGTPSSKEPRVQGPIIPDKVVRTDARSDSASQEQNVGMKFRYESNFDNFINQLMRTPGMTEEFATVLFERLGMLAESGLGENFAQDIAGFLEMIKMSPQELAGFLKTQGNSAVRYTGMFFNVLRQIMKETPSVELKSGILEFLKRYTDMSEGRHIMENIKMELQTIKNRMFPNARESLEQMEAGLLFGDDTKNGDVAQNLKMLKEKILPFLNEYVSKTHDRGVLRETAAVLSSQVARYENGELSKMIEAFTKLMDFQGMQKYFGEFDTSQLMRILENTNFEKAATENHSMEKMADIIRNGMNGEAGMENKQVFRNLMNAILLNESVYMPVLHMMLPVDVDGKLMFSEMWIDPDAEEGRNREDGGGRIIKGLIKFDIKDVGYFDLFFLYGDGKMSMQLHYPEALVQSEAEIKNSIGKILTDNGIAQEDLVLGTSRESIPISEAFPKIYERKNSVNVSI